MALYSAMIPGRRIERRQAHHHALRLQHSFLFRISPRVAWVIILPMLAAVAASEFLLPRELWFGPVYLAIIALAAWSLGTRTAIALGLVIVTVKLTADGLNLYPHGADLALSNMAIRFVAVLVIVGFIGAARKSCEREWELARTDPLTGALNRQAFFELVASGQCTGGWSALIYADLDGLKRLNDEDGHQQGDIGLRNFSGTIRRTIRKGDVFARMGGDEFVIFMKIKDEAAGGAVACRLQQAINSQPADGTIHLKCSLGILLLPDGSKSIDAELRAADALMYAAKKSGSGTCMSTAVEIDGRVTTTPPIPISEIAGRDSAVRKTDRLPVTETGGPPSYGMAKTSTATS